jgi:23S rRNA (adenine2503-C2)-methyltransferase
VRLLSGLRAKVNLIPWNPGELPFRAPEPSSIEEFQRVLIEKGLLAFVRYSRGQDIAAACGQLALIETPTPVAAAASVSATPPAPPA